MRALILAGGFGSRLQSVVNEVPKPMAPVAGRPFLEHLLDHCLKFGFEEALLSVGYKSELIISHLGNNYKGLRLEYAVEKEALGTGGAIRFALDSAKSDSLWTILNGDTLFTCDLHLLQKFFIEKKSRYGYGIEKNATFRPIWLSIL
jgi:D-glycero-alpha-D-manno-heptose 1-phosphate guanylyltransferase